MIILVLEDYGSYDDLNILATNTIVYQHCITPNNCQSIIIKRRFSFGKN